ncbi:MAG: Methionyl-tRNA formyltransferase [Eubacteriales bacterium SKADARSKE-1]|nr:Methionyl-tRNA formyltransferase [Eubacteriales bacterium SKADARSKE-1]
MESLLGFGVKHQAGLGGSPTGGMLVKIVFMGTPDFAVPSLEALINSDYKVVGVFTQPDKKRGRGYELSLPPVKKTADKYHIAVFQPQTLKNDEAYEKLLELQPDLIIVVAYGKILPENVLKLPKLGCINVHGSLLPEYRGAAPIQWAVIDGKEKTGITTMYMDKGLDTGDMLLKEEVTIDPNETSGELYDRLSKIGANLLIKTLNGLDSGTIKREKQDDAKATYAKILTKDLSLIDWNKNAFDIHNLVRGLNPWPVASTVLDSKTLKIYKTKLANAIASKPGIVLNESPFVVSCGNNTAIEILELQMENKKRMQSDAFLRGYKIKNINLS